MKSKMSILVLLASFIGAALALLLILFLMLQSGKLSKRIAAIALPAEGGYVEAWTPHLPQIARNVGIPEVSIITYDNYDKLKSFFTQAEKYNLLWAEIPVSGRYNLEKLLSDVQTTSIDKKTVDYFPPALFKVLKNFSGKSDIRFLPLSYNPWIVVSKNQAPETTDFEYSTGAYYPEAAFATLCFARRLNETDNNFLTIDEGLSDLKEMSNNKTFITNVRSYTYKDAYSVLESNRVKKAFLPVSFYNSLTVSQRLELLIEPFPSGLITDVTVAVFANRKTEELKSSIEKAKTYLLNPDLLYSTANARLWMPAHINTISRSIYTDYIRKQARQVKSCLIPGMQFDSRKEEEKLLEKLDVALRTDYLLP